MNRSNYDEACDDWALIRWRGAVTRAIRGKRGQAFLKELLETLDAMPQKELIEGSLATPAGEVCAIGSVMIKRGLDVVGLDSYDSTQIACKLGIADALVREIEFVNDWGFQTVETRFERVRSWVQEHIQQAS